MRALLFLVFEFFRVAILEFPYIIISIFLYADVFVLFEQKRYAFG
jgi:hypothetical protein